MILPIQLEQTLTAVRIAELEIGKHVDLEHPDMIGVMTHEVLETAKFLSNVRELAEKHRKLMAKKLVPETLIDNQW